MTSTKNILDVFLVVVFLVVVLLVAASLAFLVAALLASLVAFLVMSLASSSEESVFSSLKDLIIFINTHADFEDYAMIIARFKCSKKKIKNKTVLRCDRDDKSLESLSRNRRHSDTRLIQCSFFIVAKLNVDFAE
jgi:biopolymer transport protein ExbB/TolQ